MHFILLKMRMCYFLVSVFFIWIECDYTLHPVVNCIEIQDNEKVGVDNEKSLELDRSFLQLFQHYFIVETHPGTYASSFYKSQNVLCRCKFFEPAQKFDCI